MIKRYPKPNHRRAKARSLLTLLCKMATAPNGVCQTIGGKVVVLLFYPGDETPICTRQMCSVRDHWEHYANTGAEVVGISTNTVKSHKKFADHHNLPAPLGRQTSTGKSPISSAPDP